MRGGRVFELKELLGHSDIKTTMVYAHLSPDHLEQASRIVNFVAQIKPMALIWPLLNRRVKILLQYQVVSINGA